MLYVDLQVGDKIMYVGSEGEYFTFGKTYEVKEIEQYKNWFNDDICNIITIDDLGEECCVNIYYYKRSFKKVAVTITVYDDDTFATETELETLNWKRCYDNDERYWKDNSNISINL